MSTEDVIEWLRCNAKGADPAWRIVMGVAANRLEDLMEKVRQMEQINQDGGGKDEVS